MPKRSKSRGSLLVITEDGYGKHTSLKQYRRQKRGGRGVSTTSHPPLAAGIVVEPDDEIMIATSSGKVMMISIAEVPDRDRTARGARLVQLGPGERVTAATKVPRNALRIDAEAVSA